MNIKTFGLLGEKLGHSYSPFIHDMLGDYEYKLFEVNPDNIDDFLEAKDFAGLNVTIPYKKIAFWHCDLLSEAALKTNNVNTIVVNEDGKLYGDNTDYYGFLYTIITSNINVEGKKVLVLGNGGASATVKEVLKQLKAKEIVVISRKGEDNYSNLYKHFDANIVVNTTPVGMYPNNGECLINLEKFPELKGVFDLIYNPAKTALLLQAKKLKIPYQNGLKMLVAQAKYSSILFNQNENFELFKLDRETVNNTLSLLEPNSDKLLGKDCIDEILFEILSMKNESTKIAIIQEKFLDKQIENITKKLKDRMENIILVGMPGSGKTTVGRMLAKKLGREFIDADEYIEQRTGRKVQSIILEDSEKAFRDIETKCLEEICKLSGKVIATGGGAILRHENIDAISQNSRVIFIKRDIEKLSCEGRPLSKSTENLYRIFEKRLPLYEAVADFCIENNTELDVVIEKISKLNE